MPQGLQMEAKQPFLRKALLEQIRQTGVKSYAKDRFSARTFVLLAMMAEEGVLERVSEDGKQATYRLRDMEPVEFSSLAS